MPEPPRLMHHQRTSQQHRRQRYLLRPQWPANKRIITRDRALLARPRNNVP